MPGYQAFSIIRRASAATAPEQLQTYSFVVSQKMLVLIPYFPFRKFSFVNLLGALLQEYLYYTTQFISWLPFVRKIQTQCEFSKPTEQHQFVRGRAVPAKEQNGTIQNIAIGSKTLQFSIQNSYTVGGGEGWLLWGKRDRDDRRESQKTTLKILSHKNLRTLKYTAWSKLNLKNTNKPELLKKRYFKELHPWYITQS